MNYHAYELAHALLSPWRLGVEAVRAGLDHPLNPLAATPAARSLSAACQVFEKVTRRYGKPQFNIKESRSDGTVVPIVSEEILSKPFCSLRRFRRESAGRNGGGAPQVLIVAPMSGHYATLVRGTIAELCGTFDVTVTDWSDARDVPLIAGDFNLDDFAATVIEALRLIGPKTHVIAVSQSSVPALAVAAYMARLEDVCAPASLTLLGGPIDTRINPTAVNRLVENRSLTWFEAHVISSVPPPHTGAFRPVYPGFMQLTGFMTMDLDRHVSAHAGLFNDLMRGDAGQVRQHRDFYEDYLAVMDLTAAFFLDTVRHVFQEHALPNGTYCVNGSPIDPGLIRKMPLMTVEAGRDVVCGPGQTHAAQVLCRNLSDTLRVKLDVPEAGHFGLFTGSQWRSVVAPLVRDFIQKAERGEAVSSDQVASNVVKLPSARP